jgi:hypothetical protein
MAQRRTLNQRRLTKRQVQELISSGARPRPDLSAAFASTSLQQLVYELAGDRYLVVFGDQIPVLAGKGDIYAAGDFHRVVRWIAKVDEDATHGRQGSVGHWAYYSAFKHRLIANIDSLIEQLRSAMARAPYDLDFSYQSLDLVSAYVEGIGVERAQQELYDQLVAYVGEVLRIRIQGHWEVNSNDDQPYPYLIGAKHDRVMPINVVWEQLSGLEPMNLRASAANEVRRKRKLPSFVQDAETSVRATPPKGFLGTVPANAYEVRRRHADGRPWIVVFNEEVEIAGIACRDEAWFNRRGEPFGITLSHEQSLSGRRLGAGSFVRYLGRHEEVRLNDVRLGEDQEVDGLPCRRGTIVMFHANQRVSCLQLATDRDIDGVPCAGGDLAVSFHKNGRISVASLARDHVLIGRTFPRRTGVSFNEKGLLVSAALAQDWDLDGIPVKAGPGLAFHANGRPSELVLAHSHSVAGSQYERGTFLRFDKDGQLIYVQPHFA